MKTTGTITAMVSSFSLLLATAAVAQPEALEAPPRTTGAQHEATEPSISPRSPVAPKTPAQSAESERGTKEPAAPATTPSAPGRPAQPRAFLSSKTVVGATVKNPQGEELGEIQELLIDPQSGRISAAVLAFGGVLGMGAKRVAIAWETLQGGLGEGELVAALSKEQLQNAPSFETN
jgi:hypothetical protein